MEVVHNNINSEGKKQPSVEDEKALYEAIKKVPQPRKHFELNETQKTIWYWLGTQFVKTHQFTELDLPLLQRAAFWLDARNQAIKKINEEGYKGLVQKFPSGATNITGHVSIVEKADKNLDAVSAHFGMSFKDREKLKTKSVDPNQLDLFTKFLNQAQ